MPIYYQQMFTDMITETTIMSRVMDTFIRIRDHESYVPINTQIDDLVAELSQDHTEFFRCFEQAYLKICKSIKQEEVQAPEIFVSLPANLSEHLRKNDSISEEVVVLFNQVQLKLFSQMISSSIISIKIYGAKVLFSLLKSITPKLDHPNYEKEILEDVIKSIIYLIEDRSKILKRHGLKLSSLMQQENIPSITHQIQYLRNEAFGIILTGDDEETRQTAFNNIAFRKEDTDYFINRLRDTNQNIRLAVFKKLANAGVSIFQLGLVNACRVIYDGMSANNKDQRQDCLDYVSYWFGKQWDNDDIVVEFQNPYKGFLQYLRPNSLVQCPVFIDYLAQVIKNVFTNKSLDNNLMSYLRRLGREFSTKGQCTNEIFFIRVLAQSQESTYYNTLNDFIPGAGHISELIAHSYSNNQFFQVLELLKLAEIGVNSDEIGKQELVKKLVKILLAPASYVLPLNDLSEQTDVFSNLSENEIERNRYIINESEHHPVHSTIDLIRHIVRTLLKIQPMEQTQRLLRNVIQQLRKNQNNYKRQSDIFRISVKKLQNSGQPELLRDFQKKLQGSKERQSIIREKQMWLTYYLYAYTRQRQTQIFYFVHDKAKIQNLPLSILISGAFILNSPQDIRQKYNEILKICMESDSDSLERLVSIRCMTDITIKYFKSSHRHTQFLDFETFLSTLVSSLFNPNEELRLISIQSLCRLLHTKTVPQPMAYFVYLLVLWFDADAHNKSIHFVSGFIKSYISQSTDHLKQMSEYLQIFVVTLSRINSSERQINKTFVNYPIRFSQFIKKVIAISLNILKPKQTITKPKRKQFGQCFDEQENNPNSYGAEEAFVACILQEKRLQKYADIIFEKCNLLKSQNIEQLYMIRAIIRQNKEAYPKNATKNFLSELDKHLRSRNFDADLIKSLKNVLETSKTLIKKFSQQVIKGLVEIGLLEDNQGRDMHVEEQAERIFEASGIERILLDNSSNDDSEDESHNRVKRLRLNK